MWFPLSALTHCQLQNLQELSYIVEDYILIAADFICSDPVPLSVNQKTRKPEPEVGNEIKEMKAHVLCAGAKKKKKFSFSWYLW